MASRTTQLDKIAYEQAYKKAYKSPGREFKTPPSLPSGQTPKSQPTSYILPQASGPSRLKENASTGTADPKTLLSTPSQGLVDVQLTYPPSSPPQEPAVATPTPRRALKRPVPKKSTNNQQALRTATDGWVGIYTAGSDFEAKTMEIRSMASTPAPVLLQLRRPDPPAITPSHNTRPPPEVAAQGASSATQTRVVEVRPKRITLDEYYAGKTRARSSSDAPRPSTASSTRKPPDDPSVTSSHQRAATASGSQPRLTGPSPSSITLPVTRASHTALHSRAAPLSSRPANNRSKSDLPAPAAARLQNPIASVSDRPEREPSDRKALEGQMAGLPRPRGTLPGQWTVRAEDSVPKHVTILDAPSRHPHANGAKPSQDRDKQLPPQPSMSRDSLRAPARTVAESSAQRSRHHSPPPARGNSRPRDERRASVDDRALSRDRGSDPPRDLDRERNRGRGRPGREYEYYSTRSRQHHGSLWMRDSFDPSTLPPGNVPLVASILPPPRIQPTQVERSRNLQRARLPPPSAAHFSQPNNPAASTVPTRHARHDGLPVSTRIVAPIPTLVPTIQTLSNVSRLQEDFDAATLPPDAWSIDTPRSMSAPPVAPSDQPGMSTGTNTSKKLRKRPPLRLSLDQGAPPHDAPLSPPLLSPTSVASAEGGGSRLGTLPRKFLPRWLVG